MIDGAERGVDNMEMFLLLLSWACTEPKPFLLFVLAMLAKKLGLYGRLVGGHTARTSDQRIFLTI